jgi:hypothetical protein
VSIEDNIQKVRGCIARACERAGRSPDEVTLVAVTKTVGPLAIKTAFACGVRDFAENRVQEARDKIEQLSEIEDSIAWHMVGHLQTNKARLATEIFDSIQSVDSLKLAEKLNDYARRKMPILLQVNVSGEESKEGIPVASLSCVAERINQFPNLQVNGLMTIAPLSDDTEAARPVFCRLRQLRDSLGVKHLSMGMTNDFEVAIEEGATIIRVGRAVFGSRQDFNATKGG